jgi:hypothetical protein
MRVAFLPTGRTEWHGLPGAFSRRFPGHVFEVVPSAIEVASHGARYPLDGFTPPPLTAAHLTRPPEAATLLVERAATVLMDRDPPDLLVILDDLELANRDQPEHVVRVFRAAVEQHVTDPDPRRQRARDRLATRASFHLIAPMVEAWFFADPAALAVAGVTEPYRLVSDRGLEQFTTDDPSYLAATENDCPGWQMRRQRSQRPKWLGDDRMFHPKGYLLWLTRDATAKTCTRYRESQGGAQALEALDWDALHAQPAMNFLNALCEDLAYELDAPYQPPESVVPVVTSLSRRPKDHVLRNV